MMDKYEFYLTNDNHSFKVLSVTTDKDINHHFYVFFSIFKEFYYKDPVHIIYKVRVQFINKTYDYSMDRIIYYILKCYFNSKNSDYKDVNIVCNGVAYSFDLSFIDKSLYPESDY